MANPPIKSIAGLYELGHVLFILDAASHGFARADIARVESFWTFGDMHGSAAGFVLGLRDGRRAYVDFKHWHAFEQDEDFRIDVRFLARDRSLPSLSSPDEPVGGWSFETAHLDRRLAT
jgi:hypothetical protein